MIFSTPRLTALSKALLTGEQAKQDSQLAIPPALSPVIELSEALTSGNIVTGATTPPPGDQSWVWQSSFAQNGVNAGGLRTMTAPGMAPGIWHFNGVLVVQYTAAAPPNPFNQPFVSIFDNNAPANSFILARAFLLNASVIAVIPINYVVNLSRTAENALGLSDWRVSLSSPATVAGEVLAVGLTLHGGRLS